ncbi:hypothetical protein MU404_16450 [Acinetobacter baumannii]|uniref:hypothetical protein n=1 Tax=Acinetobacter baumannii TaxID=470 RepID=UPI0020BE32B5|nr:hypothetical protein [Acinetobacter baumannii]MCL6184921.1 hypothetical protein [Acinetobacter baumannii]MCL6191820.1 hypothetical protein [Acinetobacter baumannii]
MSLSSEDTVKIILAILGIISLLVGGYFAANKRSHKIGNINGNNNKIHNGDKVKNGNK